MKYLDDQQLMQMDNLGETVIARVEELLVVRELTHRTFGERAGITNRSYQRKWWGGQRARIISGTWNPTYAMITRYARALACEPRELMEPMR